MDESFAQMLRMLVDNEDELPELDAINQTPFDKDKWEALSGLLERVEAIEFQQLLLNLHYSRQEETGDICGAVGGYAGAFPELVEEAQQIMNYVSLLAESLMPELDKALALFSTRKLKAMAHCRTPGCQDREDAREELGWNETSL